MRQAAKILGLTLIWLAALDLAVAGVLAARFPALAPLTRYFYLGYSVPGKLALWQDGGASRKDTLFDVGWISGSIADSARGFAEEDLAAIGLEQPGDDPEHRGLAAAARA